MKNILLYTIFLLAVFGVVSAAPAESVKSAHVEARLVSGVEWIEPSEPFWVGIELRMDEGWHTYWKNPGDSGLATSVQWTLPEGFEAGAIQWPYPERFEEAELATYGYHGEVFLLVKISPPATLPEGSIQTLKARVRWLSCEKICIPGQAELTLDLPVKNELPVSDLSREQVFEQSRNRLPLKDHGWQIDIQDHRGKFVFQLTPPPGTAPVDGAYFFSGTNDLIDHAVEQPLKKTREGYKLSVAKSTIGSAKGREGVLVLQVADRGPSQIIALEIAE